MRTIGGTDRWAVEPTDILPALEQRADRRMPSPVCDYPPRSTLAAL